MNTTAEVISMPVPTAPVTEAQALLHMIERMSRDPSIDPSRISALWDIRTKVRKDMAEEAKIEAARVYNESMAEAQAEMTPVSRDAVNPQTKSKYASYAALDRALRPIYTRHGFRISFNTRKTDDPSLLDIIAIVTKGGHLEEYMVPMAVDGKGAKGGDVMTRPHATGSGVTYGRRYLLKMIFNIAESTGESDDDGNAAGGKPVERVSEEQILAIEAQLTKWKSDRNAFLRYWKVQEVSDLRASDYEEIMQGIEDNAKRVAANKAEKKGK